MWSCLPRLDGDPVFHALVDDGAATGRGAWAIELAGFERSEQEYVGNTAVLVTRLFSSNGSAIEVTDFCPRFERGGRMFRPQMLVRRVRAIAGTPRICVRLRPSFGYGALRPEITHGSNHIRYVSPDRVLRLTTDAPVELRARGDAVPAGVRGQLRARRRRVAFPTAPARWRARSRRAPRRTGASGRAGSRSRRNGRTP